METTETTETPAAAAPETRSTPRRPRGRPPKKVEAPVEITASVEAPAPAVEVPPLRPALREEDPRTRAARRAAELRDHVGGEMDEGKDKFWVDPAIIPPGWDYNWKRNMVMGKPDPAYEVELMRRGWEPVPASRHPEMMPHGYRGNTIEREGQILMERPLEISEEVRKNDLRAARNQVRQKEAQLNASPDGQFARDNKGAPLVQVKRGYEPLSIPKE